MRGWRRSGAPSIRSRLAWALVAWAMVWGLSVGAAVWLVAENEVVELLDDRLKASGELVATIVAAAPEASLAAAAGNAHVTVTAPNASPRRSTGNASAMTARITDADSPPRPPAKPRATRNVS